MSLDPFYLNSRALFNPHSLATVPLQGWETAEVDELFNQANATPYAFTPKERRLLRQLADNHPYHLQIVSWRLWQEKAQAHTPTKAALQSFLCQQPNPPAPCLAPPARHPAWLWFFAAIGLSLLLAVLLTWRDPAFVYGLLMRCWQGLRFLLAYWDEVGDTMQRITGIGLLVVIVGIALVGLRQRQPWGEMLHKVYQKLTGGG